MENHSFFRTLLLDSLKNRSSDNMAAIIVNLFGQNVQATDSGVEMDEGNEGHEEL